MVYLKGHIDTGVKMWTRGVLESKQLVRESLLASSDRDLYWYRCYCRRRRCCFGTHHIIILIIVQVFSATSLLLTVLLLRAFDDTDRSETEMIVR